MGKDRLCWLLYCLVVVGCCIGWLLLEVVVVVRATESCIVNH